MKFDWSRLSALREKRSIVGWTLWVLWFLWQAIGHWQNFTWLRTHFPMIPFGVVSWALALAGLVWIVAIVLWPSASNHPWLELTNELRIQNTDMRPIFDVMVLIGEKCVLESEIIPRIEANSWAVCRNNGQPISRNLIGETHVRDILSEGPQDTMPTKITYRDYKDIDRSSSLEVKRVAPGHLAFFRPVKGK